MFTYELESIYVAYNLTTVTQIIAQKSCVPSQMSEVASGKERTVFLHFVLVFQRLILNGIN